MASTHQRSASATDRRAATISGAPSRVSSTRARGYERPSVRDNGSPVLSDGFENSGDAENGFRKLGSQVKNTERRRERTTITETTIRKSPVKELVNAGNRGEPDRQRRSLESPILRRKPKEAQLAPWAPSAKLIPHTSAPLAVRVSAPPLSCTAPKSLDPTSLANMTMQDQEQSIMDDLLYVFMGYEGQYIRFRESFSPTEEKQRLAGPAFSDLPDLDPSLRDLTSSVLRMASHYSAMEAFVEVQSREEYGSVNHALCAVIRSLLKDYLILIAQLETKVINDTAFTLHQMHLAIIPTAQSLGHLYALAQELLKKNSLLEEDMDDSFDEFDADNILDRLREGGDLLPGSMNKRCIGGNVLALLTQRLATYSGDPTARSLLEMLLREASRPYMAMLNEWLHHGGIKDPYSEFLVGERSSIKRERLDEDYTDEYWEKRYYVRDKDVPPQLDNVRDKVLLAGKYLNVVRECGGVNITSKIDNTPKTFDDPHFLDNVSNAYAFANSELLNLLLTKNSLPSRLRSMKHYFFLDRAEFFSYFLELSGSELRKPSKNVNTGKLQSLLDLVLHQPGSIAAADPFTENVTVNLNDIGLTEWLMKIVNVQGIDQDNPDSVMEKQPTPAATSTKIDEKKEISGFEALELDYAVPFPLSLIVSRKTVLRYQLIFRHTLALRHLESTLVACWAEQSKGKAWTRKTADRRIEKFKKRVWNLRTRMLVFVQQMLFFATAEVMEPNWQKLMAKVEDAQTLDDPDATGDRPRRTKRTVDELMQDHLDMLDSCMKDLGLTQSKLLRTHSKLITGCLSFASFTITWSRHLDALEAEKASPTDREPAARQVSITSTTEPDASLRMTKMEDYLKRHEDSFNRLLKILIDALNFYATTESVVLLGLFARLTTAEVQNRDDMMVL